MNIKRLFKKCQKTQEKENRAYQKEILNRIIYEISAGIIEEMRDGNYRYRHNIAYRDKDAIIKFFLKKGFKCKLDGDWLKISWEHIKGDKI